MHFWNTSRILLLTAIIAYVFLFSGLAFDLHAGMRTHKADLGQIDQAVWNSSRGRLLEQTDNGYLSTRLTDHVEPILVLISPVFWLWDDVRALLLLQVIFVALGAWFVYEIGLTQFDRLLSPQQRDQIWLVEPHRSLTQPLALSLAIAYLLNAQLQSSLLTEFHAAPLAVPLILWAFWAVEKGRWRQFTAAALLTAAVKEEIALLAALLGVWAIWRGWRLARNDSSVASFTRGGLIAGALVCALSLVWFAVATFVIVPAHAVEVYGVAESGYFARYGALGDSPADIVISLITQPFLVWQILSEPARLNYLWELVAGFGLLPLLAPEVLLLSSPALLANALSAYPAQYYGEFHYSAPLIPYAATAAAIGLGRLWRWIMRRTERASPHFQHLPAAGTGTMAAAALARNPSSALRPLLAAGLVVWVIAWSGAAYLEDGRGPFGGRYDPTPVGEHHRLLTRFTSQLPADASVTATAAVHPHVSHRRFVYQFPLGLDAPTPADWALLDVTTNTDMAPGDLKGQVDAMLAADWGVVDGADGFLLLRRGEVNKIIPSSFFDFARAPDPGGEGSSLPALDIQDWPRWRQTRLVLDWPAEEFQPQLQVVTPSGDVASPLAAAPPAQIWRPPHEWQGGAPMRVTTLPLFLPRSAAIYTDVIAGAPLAVLRRVQGDRLVEAPVDLAERDDLGAALAPLAIGDLRSSSTALRVGNSAPLTLTAWLENRSSWPGDTLDVWLQWRGTGWPSGYIPFVHLRREGENVAQQDGAPRLFVGQDADALLKAQGFVNDWRGLALPEDVEIEGDWQVVVGLYDLQTGERARLADGSGDEAVVGRVQVASPAPDQACALIPAVCASQP
jgi:uncharacterized membrane protein